MHRDQPLDKKYAPIALFVYNRPEHTRRTLEKLSECDGFDQSPVFIFCDGPKTKKDEDSVGKVREIVRTLVGNKAEVILSKQNQGLAESIRRGVSSLCDSQGRAIIIEDDLLVAPFFLDYMNTALEKYQTDSSVMQISGFMFPIDKFVGREEALFLPFTTSWGWATWQRAWQKFDPAAEGWKAMYTDPDLKKKFNLDSAYDFFSMLEKQMNGHSDSWAIRWYWSVFKNSGLTLFPPVSLVKNIGFDGTGTHGWHRSKRMLNDTITVTSRCKFPVQVKCIKEDLEEAKSALRKISGGNIYSKIIRRFKTPLLKQKI